MDRNKILRKEEAAGVDRYVYLLFSIDPLNFELLYHGNYSILGDFQCSAIRINLIFGTIQFSWNRHISRYLLLL